VCVAALALDITVETRDRAPAEEVIVALAADGYQPVRIQGGEAMACPGHPRLRRWERKTWMPATSAGMTENKSTVDHATR
jgi:hypothetical protein